MLKDVKVGSLLNVILGLFVLVVVGLGFADWWVSREDRREQQQVLAQAARVVPDMDSAYIGTLRSSGTLVGLMGGVLGGGAGSGSVSADDLRRVADILKSAEASMQRARQIPMPEATARQFSEVVTAFNALVSGSVQPLLDALTRRDAAAAQRAVQGVVPGSSRLLAARDAFRLSTEQMVASYEERQAREEMISLITLIVVVIVALLLFILGRWSLQRNLVRPLQTATQWCDRIAQGDLTTRAQHDHKNEVGQLLDALRRMQESLGRTVSSVRLGVDDIHRGASEISAGNTDLSSRTEQQAASLQQTAASMEQFASAVKQNADNARQANQLAAGASDIAQRGGHVVSDVVDTMRGISGSSNKIAEIVGVIDSIAFQTNILALNAAVEAARAGEQGKGFAVVAGEVRSLAQRSAQAAREIKGLIDDSVTKVSEGSQLVERAGSTMNDIVVAVQRVTDLMGEISAASEEQATGIEQVNRAIGQMDEVTQRNAALVEEAAAAANHLGESAQQLRTAVAVFALNEGDVIDVASQRLPGMAQPAARLAKTSAPSALPGKTAGRAATGAAQLSSPTKTAARPSARTAQAPAASAPAAPRAAVTARPSAAPARPPKDDDDWESF